MTDGERDYDEEQYNAELCPACGISPCPFGGRCDEVPVVPLLSGVAVGPVERDEGPVAGATPTVGAISALVGRIHAEYGVRTLVEDDRRLVVLVADRDWSTDEADSCRFRFLLGCLTSGEATVRLVTEDEFTAVTR